MMKRIKAWWDRNSRKNQPQKQTHIVFPVMCSECGQQKGLRGVATNPEYVKLNNVTGTLKNY